MHPRIHPLGTTKSGTPVWPIAGGSDPGTGNPGQGGDPGGGDPGTGPDAGQGAGQGAGDPGTGQGGGQDPNAGGGQTPPSGDKGFPEGVPLEQMTTDQQAAYWKHYARQHEQRNKDLLNLAGGSFDQLKQKVEGYDELRQQQMTEQEQAVEAAKAEARQETAVEIGGKLVDAHVQAAVTGGQLSKEQADVLLDGLDRSKYLTQDGEVDTDKVKTLVDTFAQPAPSTSGKGNGNGGGQGNNHPDLGQGRRDGQPTQGGLEAGRERARQRYPSKTDT